MPRMLVLLLVAGCASAPRGPAVTAGSPAADVVQKQLDAYNAQDVEAFAATYAQDVVITRGPEKKVWVQGREALREAYAKMFAKYPACRARIAERRLEGDAVVLDHEIITGRGPERPEPWDVGFVRYQVEQWVGAARLRELTASALGRRRA